MRGVLLVLALATTACSSDSEPASGGTGGGAGSTSAACGGRADTFVAGLSKMGVKGNFEFILANSDPAPPQLFDNTWHLKLESAGKPLDQAEVSVSTWMPDHQHGSPKQTDVVETSPGEYELKPVNLFMPGYWEITIMGSHGGQEDKAVFKFCIGE